MFYLDLFRALDQHQVRYVLVGGLALNLHGVERATMDIDLAVALDHANLQRAVDTLGKIGMKPIAPIDLGEITKPGQLARWHDEKHMLALGWQKTEGYAPSVDILTRPAVGFEQLYRGRVTKRLANIDVSIASIDDLIALKKNTGRQIDASDIEALEKLKRIQES